MANRTIAAALFVALGAVYVFLLAPGWGAMAQFNTWDGLEYIICANLLGIDHPPGHPFYLILGKLFASLPFGNPSWNINLISALAGAAAVALLYLTVCAAVRAVAQSRVCRLIALAVSLTVGFSYVFWSHCEIAEVHTLFLALVGLSMWALLKWHAGGRPAWLGVAAFSLGVGIGVNLLGTLAVALPAVLFVILSRRSRVEKHSLGPPAALFLSGFIWYLYYPIRLAEWPLFSHPMNYLGPHKVGSFGWYVWYISGKSWTGGQMFFLGRVAWNVPLYLKFAATDLGPLLAVLSVAGIAAGFRHLFSLARGMRRGEGALAAELVMPFLLALFVCSLLPEISIHDPSNPRAREYLMNFFLPSLYLLAPVAGYGAAIAYRYLGSMSKAAAWTLLVLLLATPVYQFAANAGRCSLSGEDCAGVFSRNALAQLPHGAVVVSKLVYPLVDTYFSEVEDVIPRGKIALYDPELMTRRLARDGAGKDLFARRHRAMLEGIEGFIAAGRPVFLAADIVDEDKSPEKLLLADLDLVPWMPALPPREPSTVYPRELYLYRVEGLRKAVPEESLPPGTVRGVANDGSFANGLELLGLGAAPPARDIRADVLTLDLLWTARRPVPGETYVGIVFLDRTMRRVGEPCWHLLGGASGAVEWPPGGIVRERVNLFPPALPAGRYFLAMGMVDGRGEEVKYLPAEHAATGRAFDYVLLAPFDAGPPLPAEFSR